MVYESLKKMFVNEKCSNYVLTNTEQLSDEIIQLLNFAKKSKILAFVTKTFLAQRSFELGSTQF